MFSFHRRHFIDAVSVIARLNWNFHTSTQCTTYITTLRCRKLVINISLHAVHNPCFLFVFVWAPYDSAFASLCIATHSRGRLPRYYTRLCILRLVDDFLRRYRDMKATETATWMLDPVFSSIFAHLGSCCHSKHVRYNVRMLSLPNTIFATLFLSQN